MVSHSNQKKKRNFLLTFFIFFLFLQISFIIINSFSVPTILKTIFLKLLLQFITTNNLCLKTNLFKLFKKKKKMKNNIEDIDNCSDNTKDFILTQSQIQRKIKIDSEYYQLFSIEGTNQDQDLIDATELKELKVHCEILLESNKRCKFSNKLN
ncbi:hypothetical protein DDB_G0270740 [Dictyostelium discoideum AX4]|uniref:Transmembrane protein n=1 Tax=Dictyostelium discoideum TaxID=44689 RepID=Q55CA4_DICDI|nr:hypothetical protein DDB_G0270740 [Dictyostelium discoideum AX4]EAL72720.1 hypothetical protein DDB_G0270740 [Dictyostelium discoideum AX4]|eukprot:XP_646577.1 hypothetical protein DDB_G0270740 [Dictyostelium discoideum AX4]